MFSRGDTRTESSFPFLRATIAVMSYEKSDEVPEVLKRLTNSAALFCQLTLLSQCLLQMGIKIHTKPQN